MGVSGKELMVDSMTGEVRMVGDTAGAVFSAFSYKDASGAGAENKALNPAEEYRTRNKE